MSEPKLYLNGKPAEDFVENHEHVSPVNNYVMVLGALFFLTALTYAVSYANLGPASLPVAMGVAVVKATLVCMYFMHLRYDDRYHVFIFVSTLIFVAIFFAFTFFDFGSRDRVVEEQGTFVRRQDGGFDAMARVKKRPLPAGAHDAPAAAAADAHGAAPAAAAEPAGAEAGAHAVEPPAAAEAAPPAAAGH